MQQAVITPLPFYLDVGLVHPPRFVGLRFPTMRFFRDQGAVFCNPPIERSMVNLNATLGHDFLEITIRYRLANIEKHGVQDHVFWKVSAFETDHRGFCRSQ